MDSENIDKILRLYKKVIIKKLIYKIFYKWR